MNEYPKALYRGGDVDACLSDSVTVHSANEEAAARKDGYAMYADIHMRQNEPKQDAEPVKRTYNRKGK